MKLLNFKSITIPEVYKDSFIYTIITLLGSLLPLWGTSILAKLYSLNTYGIEKFIQNGQVYIFSAALFTPACYSLFKNKDSNNTLHTIIFLLSVVSLLCTGILFAGFSVYDLLKPISGKPMNADFIHATSYVLFWGSVIISFFAQYLENKLKNASAEPIRNADTDRGTKLEADFNAI
jgi:O-antigen/teichoic acid export membrane protein